MIYGKFKIWHILTGSNSLYVSLRTRRVILVPRYVPMCALPNMFFLNVHDNFMTYLIHCILITQAQSGSRKINSCATALVRIIDKWLKVKHKGFIVNVER